MITGTKPVTARSFRKHCSADGHTSPAFSHSSLAEMIMHCRDKFFHSSTNFAHAHFNFQIDSNSIAFSRELKFLAANIFDDARISPLLKTARIEL